MAGSMNKVILVGNLGANPESRSFQNGGKVVSLRLATNESWTDKSSGERKERAEWHTVAIYAEGAQKVAEEYLRKGMPVCIEGRLETRKWQDQAGNDRYSTEVVIRPYNGGITLIGSAPNTGQQNGRNDDAERQNGGRQSSSGQDERGSSGGGTGGGSSYAGRRSLVDDEIPFAPSIL
jgi:single-strand DNA-binding protein